MFILTLNFKMFKKHAELISKAGYEVAGSSSVINISNSVSPNLPSPSPLKQNKQDNEVLFPINGPYSTAGLEKDISLHILLPQKAASKSKKVVQKLSIYTPLLPNHHKMLHPPHLNKLKSLRIWAIGINTQKRLKQAVLNVTKTSYWKVC